MPSKFVPSEFKSYMAACNLNQMNTPNIRCTKIYEPQHEISNNFDILKSVDLDESLQPP